VDPYTGRAVDPYTGRGVDPYTGRGVDPYGVDRQYMDVRDDSYRRNVAEMERRKFAPSEHYRSDSYDAVVFPDSLYAVPKNQRTSFIQVPPAIYELDHLATFTVSHKQRLLTPEDGMRQLRHMEQTTGVWTMRVELRIDNREVVVTEIATRRELECFPISLISSPAHIRSDDPKQAYNNVVIFTAQREPTSRTPQEMHVFQCIGISGQEVADDIVAARTGKFPRPPRVSPPNPAVATESPGNRSSGQPASSGNSYNDPTVQPAVNNTQPTQPTEPTARKSTVVEDDVIQMNHCMDDIERFVASLQQAANAQKELDRHRQAGTSPADLELVKQRAQPPTTGAFVSALQKFKHVFNILTKLKAVLQEPGAEELCKTTFAPLVEVLRASRDERGDYKLASSVLSPLLTQDTCNMLRQNLSPVEVDLWQSLGNAWTTPAEKWVGPVVPTYTPTFDRTPTPDRNGNGAAVSDEQQRYLNELRSKNCKVCQVWTSREQSNAKELTVHSGEYLQIINDEKKWWKVMNIRNETGYAPSTILKPLD